MLLRCGRGKFSRSALVRTQQHVRGVKTKPTPTFPGYPLNEAIRLAKSYAVCTFEETVELQIKCGVDPKKPNQMIRGVADLPHGTGKYVRVAVFAKDAKADEARAAGADVVGGQDLADQILDGKIEFDRVIATPDMMPVVGKVARVLGPKGLMPNPKLGTVTPNITEAVDVAKRGQLQFKCERAGMVMVAVGKVTFEAENLTDNIKAFVARLVDVKPSGAKGQYIQRMYVSSSMGPSCKVDLTKEPFNISTNM